MGQATRMVRIYCGNTGDKGSHQEFWDSFVTQLSVSLRPWYERFEENFAHKFELVAEIFLIITVYLIWKESKYSRQSEMAKLPNRLKTHTLSLRARSVLGYQHVHVTF